MLVTSRNDNAKWALFSFLKEHGVEIVRSEDFQALGRVNKELALLGVVGYNGFCGNTCMMHVAGVGNWINRELLYAAFDYPFRQLGVAQVFAPVAATNARALKLDKHLGFVEHSRFPDAWADGVDLVLLTMRKTDCKWLKPLEKQHELKAA